MGYEAMKATINNMVYELFSASIGDQFTDNSTLESYIKVLPELLESMGFSSTEVKCFETMTVENLSNFQGELSALDEATVP